MPEGALTGDHPAANLHSTAGDDRRSGQSWASKSCDWLLGSVDLGTKREAEGCQEGLGNGNVGGGRRLTRKGAQWIAHKPDRKRDSTLRVLLVTRLSGNKHNRWPAGTIPRYCTGSAAFRGGHGMSAGFLDWQTTELSSEGGRYVLRSQPS